MSAKARVRIKQHFVTFFSPGTFFSEMTTKSISSWNVKRAQKMAEAITERHAATPYGFQFSTRGRTGRDLDSRELATNGMYYLHGKVETLRHV